MNWDTAGQLSFDVDGIAWDCRQCSPGTTIGSLTIPMNTEHGGRCGPYVLEAVIDDSCVAVSMPVDCSGSALVPREFIFATPFYHHNQVVGLRVRDAQGLACPLNTVTTRDGRVVSLTND